MDDLGGVADGMLAAQMEFFAENEVLESGEDTVGEDSEDEESFSGRGTHNPVAPEFKAGAGVAYLGQEGDEMRLVYVVAVHGDGKGGPTFYTAYLEGLVEKQVEGQRIFHVAAQEEQTPLCPFQYHPTLLPGSLKSRKTKMKRRNTSSICLNWQRSSNSSVWKTRNLINFSQTLRDIHSNCI
jgi:hypothetical protein